MRVGAGMALAAVLLAAAGCNGSTGDAGASACACPKPIHYSLAAHEKIQAAIDKLPRDSILRSVLTDYENERDDLRFCK